MKTIKLFTAVAAGTLLLASCAEATKKTEEVKEAITTTVEEVVEKAPEYDTSNPASMIAAVAYAQGGWDDLYNKKDVQYSYTYMTGDGKKDVSTERYIFDSEASYGKYSTNEVNAMPGTEGEVVQYYDGTTAMAMVDGKKVEDPAVIGGADFLRRANHFWFVMAYKLNDKAAILKSLEKEEYNGITYDRLEVTYDPEVTGKEQNDIYVLFINPETKLVDRFFFSLPAKGVNVPAIAANYVYEDIDGQKVATKRSYFIPNDKGAYDEENPSIAQTLTGVTFNNGFTKETILK